MLKHQQYEMVIDKFRNPLHDAKKVQYYGGNEMAMAKNAVVAGDYLGKQIMTTLGTVQLIVNDFMSRRQIALIH